MDPTRIPVAEVVPHEAPMVLLDRILSFDATTLVAEVAIGPDTLFAEADGVPAWVGLEYMAQAVAAHAGLEARLRGEPPAVGYLLGTRAFRATVAAFAPGTTLTVHVEALFVELGLGAFACRIESDGVLAQAKINVYQPVGHSAEDVDTGRISE